jgi:hypothetical protein
MLYRAETRFSGTFCWEASSIQDFLAQLHEHRGTTDDVVAVCEVAPEHAALEAPQNADKRSRQPSQQRLALVLVSLCARSDARCSTSQPCPACLQAGVVIEVTVDDSTVVSRQRFDRPNVKVDATVAQSVQRCYSRSDRRYGNVHRLDKNAGDMTTCGLYVSSRTWWLLGDETDYPVTCRACLRKPT